MVALLNNINFKLQEHLILGETIQQHNIPFYPFLVSFLYLFIMSTITFFKSNKKVPDENEPENLYDKNLLRYDENSSLIIKNLSDNDSQEIILILRKKK